MALESSILSSVESELAPMGFVKRPGAATIEQVDIIAVWARKTWNSNRGVAVLRAPPAVELGPLAQRLKLPLGKSIGYFPVFYGIGLQIIWFCHSVLPLNRSLGDFVDKIDNQRSIIQSLFVVDLDRNITESARTWGQVVSGKFQDAIARGIDIGLTIT
jgi:hypothetical protein